VIHILYSTLPAAIFKNVKDMYRQKHVLFIFIFLGCRHIGCIFDMLFYLIQCVCVNSHKWVIPFYTMHHCKKIQINQLKTCSCCVKILSGTTSHFNLTKLTILRQHVPLLFKVEIFI